MAGIFSTKNKKTNAPVDTGAIVNATKKYKPNYYTDPNDPYAMNSFADAILNKDAKRKRYGDWATDGLTNNIVSSIIGGVDVLYSNSIKPILGSAKYGYEQGGIKGALEGAGSGTGTALVNSLTNFGETVDILANPVKATAIESAKALGIGDYGSKYGGDVWQGIKSSVGAGGDGRAAYDWNTGNFITDLILEVASDPTTWLTMGASAVGKAAMKPGVKGIAKGAGLADDVADKVAKRLSGAISKGHMNQADGINNLMLRMFDISNEHMSNTFVKNLITKGTGVSDEVAAQIAKEIYASVMEGTLKGVSTLVNSKNVYKLADLMDDATIKAGLYSSGLGQVIDATKFGGKQIGKAAGGYIKELNDRPLKVLTKAQEDVIAFAKKNGKYSKGTEDSVLQILKAEGSIENKLRELYTTFNALAPITNDPVHKQIADMTKKSLDYSTMPVDPFTRFMYQKVVPYYKTGMLSTSMGLPVRNIVDIIYKNSIQQGGLLHLPKALQDVKVISNEVKNYNDVMKKLTEYVDKMQTTITLPVKDGDTILDLMHKTPVLVPDVRKSIDDTAITKFYKEYAEKFGGVPKMDQQTFREIRRLFNDPSNIVDGLSSSVKEQLKSFDRLQQLNRMLDGFKTAPLADKQKFLDQVTKVARWHGKEYDVKVRILMDQFLTPSKTQMTTAFHKIDGKYNKAFIQDAIEFTWLPVEQTVENFEKYLGQKNKIDVQDSILDKVLNKSPITKVQEWAETSGRLANYTEARMQGRTRGEAIQSIKDYHYSYNNKPVAMKVLETYFPFMSFATANAKHWDSLLNNRDVYSWAKEIRNSGIITNKKLWDEFIDDASTATSFAYVHKGKGRELYDNARAVFLDKYFYKGVPEEMLSKEIKDSAKDFYGFVKGFIRSQKDPYNTKAVQEFAKTMNATTRRSAAVKQFLRVWDSTADLESMSNPELYDYENMKRPKWNSLDPEHNYINPTRSELYRIQAGNIKYGKAIQDPNDPSKIMQRVIKMSPSYIDALNMGLNPIGNTTSRLIAPISVPLEYFKAKKNGDMYKSDWDYLAGLIPVGGVLKDRYSKTPENLAAFKSPELMMASLFGVSKDVTKYDPNNPVSNVTDKMVRRWYGQLKAAGSSYNPYDTYPQHSTVRSVSSNSYYRDLKNAYTLNGAGTGTSTVYRQQAAINRVVRPRNIYKDLYTSTGKARLRLRMGNTKGSFSQYRIRDIQNVIRKQYYYTR